MVDRVKHWSLVSAIAFGPTAAVITIYALLPESEPVSFWQIVIMCSVGGCG